MDYQMWNIFALLFINSILKYLKKKKKILIKRFDVIFSREASRGKINKDAHTCKKFIFDLEHRYTDSPGG